MMSETLGNYRIHEVLGSGGQATTLLGVDDDGGVAALKVYDAASARTARHEAELLGRLCEPGVPALIGLFEAEWRGEPVTVVAQEYVDGTSLQQIIDERRYLDETTVVQIARQLLGILAALHGHEPAMVHRDVKPANIIVAELGPIRLVDFGGGMAVDEHGDVIGTMGYAAPEQYFGTPTPRSDLYSAGATLLHLVSRRHPSEFPTENLRYQLQGRLSCGPQLQNLIELLLEPDDARRPKDAATAIALLDAMPAPSGNVEIRRDPDQLVIEIKPALLTTSPLLIGGITIALFLLLEPIIGLMMLLFLATVLIFSIPHTRLTITVDRWVRRRTWLGFFSRTATGEIKPGFDFRASHNVLTDFNGLAQVVRFNAALPELRRIQGAIRSFMAAHQERGVVLDFGASADESRVAAEEVAVSAGSRGDSL